MKTKDIEFNADDLVGSVEAFAHHLTGKQKLTLRTATMPLPVKALTPSQVRSIRKNLNVSQPVFAAMMNIPYPLCPIPVHNPACRDARFPCKVRPSQRDPIILK